MSLTVAYITARKEPLLDWFIESLALQIKPTDKIRIIVVDFYAQACDDWTEKDVAGRIAEATAIAEKCGLADRFKIVPPKPTIWAGPHRITSENWWAACNSRNTAICLCETEWLAFCDDRSVLLPGWLRGVRRAMKGGYLVAGSYEKRHSVTVESGVIRHAGIVTGEDGRRKEYAAQGGIGAVRCPGQWVFGCTFALPLEWAIAVNGVDETCGGISMEDVIFGLMLENHGFPMCYDPTIQMVEDRTVEKLGKPMRREDKGKSPDDKSHAMLAMLRGSKRAMHTWDLKAIRESVLIKGEPFPVPPKTPYVDWYDGEIIDRDYMKR